MAATRFFDHSDMLPSYVLLDLETTGGNALKDRITEVAAIRFDAGVETARIDSLVNPQQSIPYFITRLTGIDNASVEQAPLFDEIAPSLLGLLDGAVLVAHNVRFDHSFLVHEFERVGLQLRGQTLCTVRLSRRLYPEHRQHGLDALMQRHGLATKARHRAMGDVEIVKAWLDLMRTEFGSEALQAHAKALLQTSAALPPHLETDVRSIPELPGVYFFYGESEHPLYIGKSVKLRSRVMSHFSASSRVPREMRMAQEIRHIQWKTCAGELGALLLEARLVKSMQPLHNRQLRRENSLSAWQLTSNPSQTPMLTLVRGKALDVENLALFYGPYRTRQQALQHLRTLADTHQLCHHALGLSSGKGPCFAYQLKRCKGLCCGLETPERHHLRLQMALAGSQLHAWPFAGPVGLREFNAELELTEVHVFDRWCHLGTARNTAELQELTHASRQALAFDLDTYRLALGALVQTPSRGVDLLDLSQASSLQW